MKAISLWEPWASLIRTRAKTYETRSWSTSYRGRLLICAAKGGLPKMELQGYVSSWPFQGGLAPLIGHSLDFIGEKWHGITIDDLNFGKAVAIVELIDCKPTEELTQSEIGTDRAYGDFSVGRFAWKLNLLRRDFKPFPIRGSQGFFEVDDALIEQSLCVSSI
jgi:hypothetical protein